MVALALDAEEPLWMGRAMDVACARFTTFLQPENMLGYPESYIGVPDRHPMAYMAGLLAERGWDRGRVGVEMDAHFFTARCQQELQRGLPNAHFRDATLLVNWVRIVKSPQEIAYMREAFSTPWAEAITRQADSTSSQVTPARAVSSAAFIPSTTTGIMRAISAGGSPSTTVRASAAV
jgi:hypothetical protein